MSGFNPELWGLRVRHAAGLPNPPPTGSTMTDKADEIAREISLIYVPFPGRKALKDAADLIRSYAAEIEAERDRLRGALKRICAEDGITNHNGEWMNGPSGVIARRALSSPTPEGGRVIRNVEDAKLNLQKVVADVVGGKPVDPETLRAAESAIERLDKSPTPEGGKT